MGDDQGRIKMGAKLAKLRRVWVEKYTRVLYFEKPEAQTI